MADEIKEQPGVKKSSNKMLFIIIVVLGIIIGVGGALAFIMFKSKSDDQGQKPAQVEKKEDKKPVSDTMGHIIMLEPFIVNLSGSGLNYLKVEIGLELSNLEVEKEITSKKPHIQDSIILLLSTKSFDDISTGQGKLVLKDEILIRLNNILRTGSIRNIYFTSFIVQ